MPTREAPDYPEAIRLSRLDEWLRTLAPLLLAAALLLLGVVLLLTTALAGVEVGMKGSPP